MDCGPASAAIEAVTRVSFSTLICGSMDCGDCLSRVAAYLLSLFQYPNLRVNGLRRQTIH